MGYSSSVDLAQDDPEHAEELRPNLQAGFQNIAA
jgi:hypothetical protein